MTKQYRAIHVDIIGLWYISSTFINTQIVHIEFRVAEESNHGSWELTFLFKPQKMGSLNTLVKMLRTESIESSGNVSMSAWMGLKC